MTRAGVAFDAWVSRGPFVPADLVRYRVIFAGLLLLGLPDYEWVAAYPDSLFDPPPGPFMIFGGFPSHGFFIAIEVLLAVALACLVLGVAVRPASVAATLLLLTGSGFSYSLGKIDHGILLVLAPVVLVFTSWGWSSGEASGDKPVPQWPMRLFALLIGAGFLTAAAPKVLAGWLSPSTQALQETAFRQYYVNGRTEMLADQVVHMPFGALWEFGDWSIIILEAAVILCAVNWTAFRVVLALLALFHLGVYPTMNISFAGNVIVYGAFVSWSRVPTPRAWSRVHVRGGPAWARAAVAVVFGVLAWVVEDWAGPASGLTGPLVLVAGAATGAVYLLLVAREWVRGRHGIQSEPQPRVEAHR